MRTSDRSITVRVLARSLALTLAGAAVADGDGAGAATPVRIRDLPNASRHADEGPIATGSNLTVTNCADSGPGSLRQAMLDARNNTTVDFSQLHCSTITLTTGALTDPDTDSLKLLATPAVVNGKPQPVVTINGGDSSRIIEHRSGGRLELTGIALAHGRSTAGKGGCLYAMGHVTLTAVTVSACVAAATGSNAALGGGIWSDDQVDLVYSTVSGNVALATPGGYSYGGGVFSTYGFYSLFSSIQSNDATGFGYGGGVSVVGYASVKSSTVTANIAAYGAGLALFGQGAGDFSILNSTVSSNHATGFAAGIEASGPLNVYNSTIAFNIGDHANTANDAAGIVIEGGDPLTLVSSIVARNTQGGVAHDIGGSVGGSVSGSNNLVMNSTFTLPAGTISADPLLNIFGNYGGQTLLLGLQPNSPAINAGSNPLNTLCDQRGGSFVLPFGMTGIYQRSAGAATDIGAFEYAAGDQLFADGFEAVQPFSCYPL